ncbi:hypothetical protein K3495_g1157 [Podosphaera aphanis]|nr:hypothetical protein K3495_g1157 [Podosphaera aphanis]
MKKPTDIHAQGSLTPVRAPPPFLRWSMDFIGPVKHGTFSSYFCTAIEYATSLRIALFVNSTDTSRVNALFNLISISFGLPKQLIVDNASAFVSFEQKNYLTNNGTSLHPTKPYRPVANGKAKKFNGISKQYFLSVSNHPDYTNQSISTVLSKSLQIYNRRQFHIGYSPYFLAFGSASDENPVEL